MQQASTLGRDHEPKSSWRYETYSLAAGHQQTISHDRQKATVHRKPAATKPQIN
jgi:hypothetical protein